MPEQAPISLAYDPQAFAAALRAVEPETVAAAEADYRASRTGRGHRNAAPEAKAKARRLWLVRHFDLEGTPLAGSVCMEHVPDWVKVDWMAYEARRAGHMVDYPQLYPAVAVTGLDKSGETP